MKKNSFTNLVQKRAAASALFACGWIFTAAAGFAQANFIKGQEFLMHNKPLEALPYLEHSVLENPGHVEAFLYLGIVYEQLDRTDEAIAAYRKILSRAGDFTATVATNLGNAYFVKGNTEFAEQFYSQALEEHIPYPRAYLGRANTRLKAGSLPQAIEDYEAYLSLEPRSPQRPRIERLMAFIRAEFAAEERRKLMAEEEARAEAERRRRLLEEVASSLQTAADSSQGLSSGAENVEAYDGEFELE